MVPMGPELVECRRRVEALISLATQSLLQMREQLATPLLTLKAPFSPTAIISLASETRAADLPQRPIKLGPARHLLTHIWVPFRTTEDPPTQCFYCTAARQLIRVVE